MLRYAGPAAGGVATNSPVCHKTFVIRRTCCRETGRLHCWNIRSLLDGRSAQVSIIWKRI